MFEPQNGSGPYLDPLDGEIEAMAQVIAPQALGLVKAINMFIITILGWHSLVFEVFARWEFGERYLSIGRLLVAFLICIVWIVAFRGTLMPWITIAFLLMAGLHRMRIWSRYSRGIEWHSRSFGISHFEALGLPEIPFVSFGDYALYRFYEPGIYAFIAWVVYQYDPASGAFLFVSAFAAFWGNNMAYAYERARILDLIDAKIEAQHFNATSFGKDKRDIAGIAPISVVWPTRVRGGDASATSVVTNIGNHLVSQMVPASSETNAQEAGNGFADTVAETLKPRRTED